MPPSGLSQEQTNPLLRVPVLRIAAGRTVELVVVVYYWLCKKLRAYIWDRYRVTRNRTRLGPILRARNPKPHIRGPMGDVWGW